MGTYRWKGTGATRFPAVRGIAPFSGPSPRKHFFGLPARLLRDLRRVEEQREYLRTQASDAKDRRGKLHFRKGFCRAGCPSFGMYLALRGRGMGQALDTLKRACEACALECEPMRDVERVEMMWNWPDSLLRLETQPYHFVAGVTILRLRNRSGF